MSSRVVLHCGCHFACNYPEVVSHRQQLWARTMLRRSSRSNDGHDSRPNVLTKSPPSSPVKETQERQVMAEPYPIPSNNPASQYTLLEKLGTGSFGTVYKAMHNETKQIVAIKQIGA